MGGMQAEHIAAMLGYDGSMRVDAKGFTSGIWITRVREIPWYFSAIYASLDITKRHELWRTLKEFSTSHNRPWLLARDFNDTRLQWERNQSCPETTRRSNWFNEWVNEMQSLEVEF
ncbi:Nucleolar protein 6 [Bienertia sinuspersici]